MSLIHAQTPGFLLELCSSWVMVRCCPPPRQVHLINELKTHNALVTNQRRVNKRGEMDALGSRVSSLFKC